MIRFSLLLAGFLLAAPIYGATLLCGDEACDGAQTEIVDWPSRRTHGIPIISGPRVKLDLPGEFESIQHHDNMVSYHYPAGDDGERYVYLVTSRIGKGESTGPTGGWDPLFETSKDGVVIYYYSRPSTDDAFIAVVRNKDHEDRSAFGSLRYLTLGTVGFSREEFLEMIGSVRQR